VALAESSLDSPPRYHWQARCRAASGCADRALLDDTQVFVSAQLLLRADSDLARAALGVNALARSCPLTRCAAHLLAHGRRTSTKKSYCGKWQRFVDFCTVTFPHLYGQPPRSPLPAGLALSSSTLRTSAMTASCPRARSTRTWRPSTKRNEDRGYDRPALGHYFRGRGMY
jgi:hypothetical protein